MPKIAVMGAGGVGCYLGGSLAAAGARLILVGREPAMAELRTHGLHLTSFDGGERRIEPTAFTATSDATCLATAELIMLTVKSAGTADAAATIARVAPGVPVVSFQNGVDNMALLSAAVGSACAIQGMVPYNIVRLGPGWYHRGVSGLLLTAPDLRLERLASLFAAAGVPLAFHDDMPGVGWAKLLVNLNNAVNALSGLPLLAQLADRDLRRVLAASQTEALRLLRGAGIVPAKLGPLPPRYQPLLLSLPNSLFTRLSRRNLPRIDEKARSSMADDIVAGRRTEIDHINGAVVTLAERLGRNAPINRRLVELVRAAERGAPPWSSSALLKEIRTAR